MTEQITCDLPGFRDVPTLEHGLFYGRQALGARAHGLVMSETVYGKSARVPMHVHRHPYLCFVLEGGFQEISAGTTAHCAPGALVYHPRYESHADTFGISGGRCFNVQFDASWDEALQPIAPDARRVIAYGSTVTATVARLRASVCNDDLHLATTLESTVLQLLARIQECVASRRDQCNPRTWLVRVADALQATIESPKGIREIARDAGVHPVHLARAFRQHYGRSPSAYVRELRVDRAAVALATTRRPVSEIAYEMGYADESHLCRAFKQIKGITPTEYRAGL